MIHSTKRQRLSSSSFAATEQDDDEDGGKRALYVPLKERRRRLAARLKRKRARLAVADDEEEDDGGEDRKRGALTEEERRRLAEEDDEDDGLRGGEDGGRSGRGGGEAAKRGGEDAGEEEEEEEEEEVNPMEAVRVDEHTIRVNNVTIDTRGKSLLDINHAIRRARGRDLTEEEKIQKEEKYLLERLTKDRVALKSAKENAQGSAVALEPLKAKWKPPKKLRGMSEEKMARLRKKWHIIVEGEDCPPPIKSFKSMRFPQCLVDHLHAQGIVNPTPIQIQGIPAALARRDMIGIAFTGSGKTLAFSLPMVLFALESELGMPLKGGEGPCGLIICPSRELTRQSYEVIKGLTGALVKGGLPELRTMLCIGGENMAQFSDCFRLGVHMVVATPGRLLAMLKDGKLNMMSCRYLCLDEADRMIDMGFEEDIRTLFDYFPYQRQTVLYSATMPNKIRDFALESLVKPIVVNVGRAGAASLDVIQEVEYVKKEARIRYLLEVIQKSCPPVLIFASSQGDVDDIQEYLLVKGVNAVSIHGGKAQEERVSAIRLFKSGKADILVATDVAGKGLDFPNIEHVINFDMPKEIEDYVHRIGRTGRCGKTGIATTFINREVPETTLLDLKHLLQEARQKIPPVLMTLEDPTQGKVPCGYCGGLGHRVIECPKLSADNKAKQRAFDVGGRGSDLV